MSRQKRLILDAGTLIDIETDPHGETFGHAAVLTSELKDLAKLASAAEYPVRLLTV